MTIPTHQIERARTVPIDGVIAERGIKLKRVGGELIGACPKCGGVDRFAINPKKGVFNCRQCEKGGDVIALVEHLDDIDFVAAVRLLAGEPPKANGKDRKPAVEFHYHDESGALVFAVERIESVKDGKHRKTFRQKRPDPDRPGAWLWNVDGVPLLPYRLPEVIEALANERTVLIVEGEAKAELLWSWNVPATCNAGGAKKWRAEHSAFLKGADVVLVPDHDDAGWAHINFVGSSLVGIASRIRVLILPGLRPKGDVIDWAKAGGTREQLDALIADATEWHAPTADDEKAKAKAHEDELLDALVKAQGLDYARGLKDAAEELEVSQRAIDQEVRTRREDAGIAPLFGHWIVEPWPEVVEGDSLLRDLIRRFKRHVIMTDEHALTIALFLLMGAVHDDVATHSPILNINSAEPESGKSTTLGLISFLLPKCIATVEASEAALYRAIERWSPSFCIDEFDTVMIDDDKRSLRSIINSGHTRGTGVLRCERDRNDRQAPVVFPTFATKVIGMVGRKLPPAMLSRCIFIDLRRRRRDEQIEKFHHEDDAELADLRRRIRRWADGNAEALRHVEPTMPYELWNRRGDNWSLLIAIADLCSGVEDFGDKARAAAIKIEGKADSRTIGVCLLTDIKKLFDADPFALCMSSATMVAKLTADPEGSWAEFSRGKPLTQNRLAKMLGGSGAYGIVTRNVTPPGEKQAKGYLRADFEEVWAIYVS